MWDVIVWKEENAIDFVPSIWANSDRTSYKYPLGLSENSKRGFIYACKDVNNFVWCEAVVKKSKITNLEKAKDLCKRGQETSTIETSSDSEDEQADHNKEKRKRKLPRRFIDDSSEEEGIQAKKSKSNPNQSQSQTCSQACPIKTFTIPVVTPPRSPASATTKTVDSNFNDSSCSNSVLNLSSLSKNKDSGDCSPQFLFHVQEIYKKLNSVENLLLAHVSQCPSTSAASNDLIPGINFNLPVSRPEELNRLNESIQEQNRLNELVQLLFLLGGDDPHKSIFTMMNKLMSKNLATRYSGIGKKKKLPFLTLKFVCEAITIALRKRFPTVLDSEIKKSIAVYLASAKSRLPKD